MRTIEIEDDVYGFLLRNTSRFGESASDVIRRLAGMGNSVDRQMASPGTSTRSDSETRTQATKAGSAFTAFLNSPAFLVQGNVVGKFLSVLSWLYKQNPEQFQKVLLLNGRKRRYFAKSANELEESGNSVMPKRIPDTPFWVFTNSPTQLKKQVLADVMRVLGYDSSTTRSAIDAMR